MRTILFLPIAVLLSGCAAILGSKQKDFSLTSTPLAADVYLNGNRLGRTPLTVKLSNQATHTFVFRRQGYHDATCTLTRGTDAGWVILDVLSGLVPIVIDAATNSWSQTKGDGCSQSLDPLNVATPAPTPAAPPPAQPDPLQEQLAPPITRDTIAAGSDWIADARDRMYYPAGCPSASSIPQADRLLSSDENTLQRLGFTRSEACPPGTTPAPVLAESPDTNRLPSGVTSGVTPISTAESTATSRTRSGFWFNIGPGYGSLGCDGCGERDGSWSGGLALGGTLSQKVVLGVGSNGWYQSENGVAIHAGTLTALIRFYPSATGGFFLLGGLGVGTISVDVTGFGSERETGGGAVLGLGYDIRVGNNVSLTPFWNGFAVKTSNSDANVGQIGLGLTIH